MEIFRVIAAFLKKIWENPTKFHEKSKNHDEIWKKSNFSACLILKTPKESMKICWKFKYWGLSGAKACKSCRSRQELSNEYLLAKFGFDTAENEPEYGYRISLIFVSLIFGPIFPPFSKTKSLHWKHFVSLKLFHWKDFNTKLWSVLGILSATTMTAFASS